MEHPQQQTQGVGVRVDTPLNRTLEEIEASKSNYRRARQQLFDRLHKEVLSADERYALAPFLKRTLDEAEWLLDVSRKLMKPNKEDYKKNEELNQYLRSFQIHSDEKQLKELDRKLKEFEDLITDYIDKWKPDPVEVLLDGGDLDKLFNEGQSSINNSKEGNTHT